MKEFLSSEDIITKWVGKIENLENEFKKIDKSIRLILEILKEDKVIFTTHFFTKTFINHLELNYVLNKNNQSPLHTEEANPKGKEKDKKITKSEQTTAPFNMILKLDLSEAPIELQNENEDKEKLNSLMKTLPKNICPNDFYRIIWLDK